MQYTPVDRVDGKILGRRKAENIPMGANKPINQQDFSFSEGKPHAETVGEI